MSQEEYDTDEKNSSTKFALNFTRTDKDDKTINLPVTVAKEIEGYTSQIGEAEPLPSSYGDVMEKN